MRRFVQCSRRASSGQWEASVRAVGVLAGGAASRARRHGGKQIDRIEERRLHPVEDHEASSVIQPVNRVPAQAKVLVGLVQR
jgi:hypothetical protein